MESISERLDRLEKAIDIITDRKINFSCQENQFEKQKEDFFKICNEKYSQTISHINSSFRDKNDRIQVIYNKIMDMNYDISGRHNGVVSIVKDILMSNEGIMDIIYKVLYEIKNDD